MYGGPGLDRSFDTALRDPRHARAGPRGTHVFAWLYQADELGCAGVGVDGEGRNSSGVEGVGCMRAQMAGAFAVGFAAGMLTLAVLMWHSGGWKVQGSGVGGGVGAPSLAVQKAGPR